MKKPKTMDVILVIVAVLLISFTVKMIFVFEETGAIPDTLCSCVYATLGGECGVMGWIQTTKTRNRDRTWQLEDRKEEKEEAKKKLPENPNSDSEPAVG